MVEQVEITKVTRERRQIDNKEATKSSGFENTSVIVIELADLMRKVIRCSRWRTSG